MFRFFDRNFDNEISFKEFRVVCEELDLRFTADDTKLLFEMLDIEQNGIVGFHEFLNIAEENRLNLDPFKNAK